MQPTLRPIDWKDQASIGNDTQVQRAFPMLSEVPPLVVADQSFICRASWDGVCRLAVQQSGKDDFEVADEVAISHGYISKILRGTAGLYGKRLVKFMLATHSLAPLQWLAEQVGCDVVPRSVQSAEIARLKAQLAELERSAA